MGTEMVKKLMFEYKFVKSRITKMALVELKTEKIL